MTDDELAWVQSEVKRQVRQARRRDRLVLTSWGMAVVILACVFSWRVRANDRQQDRDMCAMIGVFLSGPEPVEGPAGERSRVVRKALTEYLGRRHCPSP